MKAKEGSALGLATSMAANQCGIGPCEWLSDGFSQILEVQLDDGGDYNVPVVIQLGRSHTWC